MTRCTSVSGLTFTVIVDDDFRISHLAAPRSTAYRTPLLGGGSPSASNHRLSSSGGRPKETPFGWRRAEDLECLTGACTWAPCFPISFFISPDLGAAMRALHFDLKTCSFDFLNLSLCTFSSADVLAWASAR